MSSEHDFLVELGLFVHVLFDSMAVGIVLCLKELKELSFLHLSI